MLSSCGRVEIGSTFSRVFTTVHYRSAARAARINAVDRQPARSRDRLDLPRGCRVSTRPQSWGGVYALRRPPVPTNAPPRWRGLFFLPFTVWRAHTADVRMLARIPDTHPWRTSVPAGVFVSPFANILLRLGVARAHTTGVPI